MLIKMLSTRRGSEDSFKVKRYEMGREYDVADSMGREFCRNGWAYNSEIFEDPASDFAELIYQINKPLILKSAISRLPNPHMKNFNANVEAHKAAAEYVPHNQD